MPTTHIEMHEDDFYAKFKPLRNPNVDESLWGGGFYDTYGDDLTHVKSVYAKNPETVWTIVECDGHMSITEGFHYVNRMGYLITEVPAEPDTTYEITDPDMHMLEDSDED